MDIYHKILRKIAHIQAEYPLYVLLFIALLSLAIYGGVSKVNTVASLEQMMPNDIEEIHAFNTLRDNHMGQDMIAIVIEVDRSSTNPEGIFDIRDERVYGYVKELRSLIQSEPDVLETYDMAEIIDMSAAGDYEQKLHDNSINKELSNFINSDYTKTIIIITTDVSANDPRMKNLAEKIKLNVESAGKPSGVEIKYTGTPIIQQRLGELITKDRQNTRWISTLFVFLITLLIFGTFTSALVPIIVVTVSVTWLYGTMGYTGLPISTLAGGVAAMVIGIGIDFAIHIMNKFKYERKKGYTIKKSIERAVVETGTALTATSVTTISAFLAFLIGQMPEMGRFGILMAIGIAFSLIFSLFGLPALLVLEEKIIAKYYPKLKFGVEGEYHLKKGGKK